MTISLDVGFFAEALAEHDPEDNNPFHSNLLSASAYLHRDIQWRRLLNRPFEKVTLLIIDCNRKEGTSNSEQLPNIDKLPSLLRSTLEEMGENIGSNWLSYQTALDFNFICQQEEPPRHHFDKYGEYDPTPKRKWYKSAEAFRVARVQYDRLSTKGGRREVERRYIKGDDEGLSARRIQTNQICFAWNLLPPATPLPGKLKGQKFRYTAEHAESLRKTDQLRKLKYDNAWLHRYEVMGADGLVGEMGIQHPNRWILASEEYDDYHGLMTHLEEVEDVESKGIGMKLTKSRKPHSRKGKERDEQ